MIVFPAFWKVTSPLLIWSVILLVLFVINLKIREGGHRKQWEHHRHVAETLIKPSDLTLETAQMARPDHRNQGLGDQWVLRGLVSNHSRYVLLQMTFDFTVVDCQMRQQPPRCSTVDRAGASADVTVPPRQSLPFSTTPVRFDALPLTDDFSQRAFDWTLARAAGRPLTTRATQ
jgi:hypothetical protein